MSNGEIITQIDALLDGNELSTKAASRMQLIVLRELYVKQDAQGKVIAEVSRSVEKHHESFHLAPAMKNPKFWTIIAGSFILLHGLAEALQSAGVSGWAALAKALGL